MTKMWLNPLTAENAGFKTCIFQYSGAPCRTRTGDLRVTNALLYQLSQGSTLRRWAALGTLTCEINYLITSKLQPGKLRSNLQIPLYWQ